MELKTCLAVRLYLRSQEQEDDKMTFNLESSGMLNSHDGAILFRVSRVSCPMGPGGYHVVNLDERLFWS